VTDAVDELRDYVRRNRAEWDSWAPDFVPDATTEFPFVTLEWARQWPCEEVWKARKRG
jgi:hypothetical protein